MTQQTTLPPTELILQRLDLVATELQLLRQALMMQNSLETEASVGIVGSPTLPDLRDFRASLTVHGQTLREVVLTEREEQRF